MRGIDFLAVNWRENLLCHKLSATRRIEQLQLNSTPNSPQHHKNQRRYQSAAAAMPLRSQAGAKPQKCEVETLVDEKSVDWNSKGRSPRFSAHAKTKEEEGTSTSPE